MDHHTFCTICTKSDSTPRNFLLDCNKCNRSWHHRCHKPPVPDLELLKYIKETTNLLRQQIQTRPQRPTFTCAPCKQPVTLEPKSNPSKLVQVITIDHSDEEVPPHPKPLPINQIASKKSSLPRSIPIRQSNPPLAQGTPPIINHRPSNSSFLDRNRVKETASLQGDHVTRPKDAASSPNRPEKQTIEPSSPFRRGVSFMDAPNNSHQTTSSRSPSLYPRPSMSTKQTSSLAPHRFVSLPRFEALSMSKESDEEDEEEEEDEEDELADDDNEPLQPIQKQTMDIDRNLYSYPAQKSSDPSVPSTKPRPPAYIPVVRQPSPHPKPLPDLLNEDYAQAEDAWARAAARRRQIPVIPRQSLTERKLQRRPVFRPSIPAFNFDVDTWMSHRGILS